MRLQKKRFRSAVVRAVQVGSDALGLGDDADAAPRADREAATDAAAEGGQPATEADPPAQGDAAPPADDGAGAAADGNAPPPGLLRDLENVVVTFFTSLLPAWPAGEPAGQEVAAGGL